MFTGQSFLAVCTCGIAYGIQDYTHVKFEEEYVPLFLNFRFLVLEGRGINTLIP